MSTLARYMSSTHMPAREDWGACINLAAEAGFDGLELFGTQYTDEEAMAPQRLRALAAAAQARGLQLSGHPWMEWDGLDLDALRQQTSHLLEDCARLGLRRVNIHMAFLASRAQGLPRLFAAVDPVTSFLRREGMVLLFENVPAHGIRELGSEVDDFAALFAHYQAEDTIMMTIDNGHAHVEGNLEALAGRCGARWRYTHINDNDGIEDWHWVPGQGSADWQALASHAQRAGYVGPLMMEYAFEGVPEALDVMRPAFAGAGYEIGRVSIP